MTAPCPICSKPGSDAHRPFCSSRCADIDLGRWLTEQYVLPGQPGEAGDETGSAQLDRRAPVE